MNKVESKAGENLTDAIQKAFASLTWGDEPIFTVEKMAMIAECHPRIMYRYIKGEAKIPADVAFKMSREACKYGILDLAKLSLDDEHTAVLIEHGKLNGDVTDDAAQLVLDLGVILDDLKKGNVAKAKRRVGQLMQDARTIEAEVDAK